MMLTLRTTIGLTQAGLAERLGVSRRAVLEWEAGSSYPKVERLTLLIELGVQQQAFPTGREAEEIHVLWKAAHQKVLLDEAWLQDLLASARPIPLFPQAQTGASPADLELAAFRRVDWVGALDTSHFTGREVEVAELSQWMVQERCRLVTLLGMGASARACWPPSWEAVSLLTSRRCSGAPSATPRFARTWSPIASPSSPKHRLPPSPPRWSNASASCWHGCKPIAAC